MSEAIKLFWIWYFVGFVVLVMIYLRKPKPVRMSENDDWDEMLKNFYMEKGIVLTSVAAAISIFLGFVFWPLIVYKEIRVRR